MIAVTGAFRFGNESAAARALGAQVILLKPFTTQELLTALEEGTGESRAPESTT